MDSIFEPFLLSLIAGMATGFGGMIVLLLRRVGDRVVSFSMGFASGVMLMVAFNNLFLERAHFNYLLSLLCTIRTCQMFFQ
jgi:ZIP family zinc transporter